MVVMLSLFAIRHRTAALLLITYGAWMSFAVALNGAIVWMNGDQ